MNNSTKADLGAKIKELQQGEKEVVDNAIDTNGTGSTGLGKKKYEDLQENIQLNEDGTITGTLKKVDNYKAFSSSNGTLQKGYYLALKIDKSTVSNAQKVNVVKWEKNENSWTSTNKDLDESGIIIIRIPDVCIDNNDKIKEDSLKLEVKFYDSSNKTIAINEYDLSQLTLSTENN